MSKYFSQPFDILQNPPRVHALNCLPPFLFTFQLNWYLPILFRRAPASFHCAFPLTIHLYPPPIITFLFLLLRPGLYLPTLILLPVFTVSVSLTLLCSLRQVNQVQLNSMRSGFVPRDRVSRKTDTEQFLPICLT